MLCLIKLLILKCVWNLDTEAFQAATIFILHDNNKLKIIVSSIKISLLLQKKKKKILGFCWIIAVVGVKCVECIVSLSYKPPGHSNARWLGFIARNLSTLKNI